MSKRLESWERCDLPPDWEAVIQLEMLTGCSLCERRLLDDGTLLRPGVGVLKMLDVNGGINAVYILCKECSRNVGQS